MQRPSRGRRVWYAPLVREGNSLMLLAASGTPPPRGGPRRVRGAGSRGFLAMVHARVRRACTGAVRPSRAACG